MNGAGRSSSNTGTLIYIACIHFIPRHDSAVYELDTNCSDIAGTNGDKMKGALVRNEIRYEKICEFFESVWFWAFDTRLVVRKDIAWTELLAGSIASRDACNVSNVVGSHAFNFYSPQKASRFLNFEGDDSDGCFGLVC